MGPFYAPISQGNSQPWVGPNCAPITKRDNLNQAYRRVKSNKGAPGVDGMTLRDLGPWIKQYKEELIASLTEGSYQPQPVRRVDIPKPGGGMRQLGKPPSPSRWTMRYGPMSSGGRSAKAGPK